jgi:predicted nucleic acid-binding protein
MKVLYDANVLLDVFQYREPFYEASVLALNASMNHLVVGYFPAHAVPIISYVVRRHADKETAALAVNWLLDAFEIAPCDGPVLRDAAGSTFKDFEDAIVAYSALQCSCDVIVTRNTGDFLASPIPALNPIEFLSDLNRQQESDS